MSIDITGAVLSYAMIPLYVIGLLSLIYIIAHRQLGFSLVATAKQEIAAELVAERPKTPLSTYLVVFAVFALLTTLAVVNQRRLHA